MENVLIASSEKEARERKVGRERFFGKVKSFNATKGFGFITCDKFRRKNNTDVYVHKSQMNGAKIGDDVSFFVQFKNLDPQAVDLKQAEPEVDDGPITAPAAGATTTEMNQVLTELIEQAES